MDRNMGIYKITNTVNGKFYIGSSINIKERIRQHKVDLKANNHVNGYLQNSYNKHGEGNFLFEIIEYVDNRKALRDKEQWYLDNLNACDRSIGYNISKLALGNGLFGKDNYMFGNGHLVSGKRNGFYGKRHSKETKEILSQKCPNWGNDNGNYGNRGIKNPLSKQIAQIDIDTLEVKRVWGASIEIKRELGYHSGTICDICILIEKENIWKIYKGYYWCYEKDLKNLTNKIDYVDTREKKVVQLSKDKDKLISIHDSLTEAGKAMRVRAENISRVCSGVNQTSCGYKWMFYEDYQALTK